jgi:hypothetical protein
MPPRCGGIVETSSSSHLHQALLGVHRPQILDDLEAPAARLVEMAAA